MEQGIDQYFRGILLYVWLIIVIGRESFSGRENVRRIARKINSWEDMRALKRMEFP